MEKNEIAAKRIEDGDLHGEQWILYVDGASNENGSGAGTMLISPEEHKIHCALCFRFQASSNEAEYEAFLEGLRLVKELKVNHLKVYSDSQLVVNRVNETYQAREEKMVTYLEKAKELIRSISKFLMPMHWPSQLPLRMLSCSMLYLWNSYLNPA